MSNILEECVECGACIKTCELLKEIGQPPSLLEKQGVTVNEAFSCSLCGACETVCPVGLSPKKLFADSRRTAVNKGDLDISDYRYLFPDRKNNVMNTYRNYYGIDYSDIESDSQASTVFFPGCTLLTYSPGLTREIYDRLKNSGECQEIWTECCGKPLDQMGLQQRYEVVQKRLIESAEQRNINKIITACPGCYYELKSIFQPLGINVLTVYEVMNFEPYTGKGACTIHDACPDRLEGRFARQVRQALEQCGFSIIEMEHSKEHTICCGSGGQLSHFRPDLKEKLVNFRLDEARHSGADILVGYCLSCVLNFDSRASEFPVTHVLNLLLNQRGDFSGAKERAQQMLAGTKGEKIWEKIMAD